MSRGHLLRSLVVRLEIVIEAHREHSDVVIAAVLVGQGDHASTHLAHVA